MGAMERIIEAIVNAVFDLGLAFIEFYGIIPKIKYEFTS
jgi:uncharacterized protein YutE (UPF0331/DUF86 family)